MNDLELVRELRAEIGSPSPAQLARGRARLSDAIERPHRRRRRAPTLAIAATVAGVAAVAVLASGRGVGERARAPHLTLAAKVLHEAARVAAAASTVEPGAQQWIYTKAVDDEAGQGDERIRELAAFRRPRQRLPPGRTARHARQSGADPGRRAARGVRELDHADDSL